MKTFIQTHGRIALGKVSRSTRGAVYGTIERVGLFTAGIRLS